MTFATLTVVGAVALLGPLLALVRRVAVPVVVGQVGAGLLVGASGLHWVDATDPGLTFLAQVGFALVMFVAGTHVRVTDPAVRRGAPRGALRAALVGVLAVPAAWALGAATGTGHTGLYAVLLASSSAALVLPVLDGMATRRAGREHPADRSDGSDDDEAGREQLLAQVAVADTACLVALPLVLRPGEAGRTILGVAAVGLAATALYLTLRTAERRGTRRALHRVSQQRRLALELRLSLTTLFAVAALASALHVSVMLAGFACGLAVSAVGEPRRLARQLFGLSEGFLGPLFFVWVGASVDLGAVGQHPASLLLGLGLGLTAVAVHSVASLTGLPAPLAVLGAAQLGLPIAAVTLGREAGLLRPGEDTALLVGALVTVVAAAAAARAAAAGRRTG